MREPKARKGLQRHIWMDGWACGSDNDNVGPQVANHCNTVQLIFSAYCIYLQYRKCTEIFGWKNIHNT